MFNKVDEINFNQHITLKYREKVWKLKKTMSDKIKEILKKLPLSPGVYMMTDSEGIIIYIGKAGSLKKRVSSYFQKKEHDPKTRVLVKNIDNIEVIVTDTEVEALLLESNLIKKHKPKFNVRLKDDKRYPYIAVTLHEEYPRIIYTRSINKSKDKYFGPYTDATAARNTVAMINNLFKLKTCRKEVPLKKGVRPCLNYQIKKCSGACLNKITREEYRKLIDDAVSFLEGNINPVIVSLNSRMKNHSEKMEYEKALAIRDIIFDIQKISQSQKVDVHSGLDQDYIGVSIYGSEAVLIIFEFRHGVLIGRKVSIFDNAEYSTPEEVIRTFIIEYYNDREIPARIVTSVKLADAKILASHLREKGVRRISIAVAVSANDRGVVNMLNRNIDMLVAERNKPGEYGIGEGLKQIKDALNLDSEPEIIECFDISNFHGTDSVASMVMFRNGKPEKKSYRRYKIRGYNSANDPAMIHEVVSRRIQYLVNEDQPLPDLMVIDGGPIQLRRAMEAAANFDVKIKIVSLAKRLEEIFTSPNDDSLLLKEGSPGLKIMQNIRDEAHRFAITYHRKLRDKRTTSSLLDGISGIGEKDKRALLFHFDSIEKIINASVAQLEEAEGIGKKKAMAIRNFFDNR